MKKKTFGFDISVGLTNCGPFAAWANNLCNWFRGYITEDSYLDYLQEAPCPTQPSIRWMPGAGMIDVGQSKKS